jgi:hypothetical protein
MPADLPPGAALPTGLDDRAGPDRGQAGDPEGEAVDRDQRIGGVQEGQGSGELLEITTPRLPVHELTKRGPQPGGLVHLGPLAVNLTAGESVD